MNIDEMKLAARVHYSFLPEQYDDDSLNVVTQLIPKAILGGDYCSVIPLGEQKYAVCICDAVGHGVASALYAARINTFVLSNILQGHNPCDLISELNKFLCRRLIESGMYASFFIVLLDIGKMEMQYAGAGHPPVLHLSVEDNKAHWLSSETTLLGFEHPLPIYCPLQVCSISPGDKIVLYTDGLTEARNKDGEEFGDTGLERYAISHIQGDNKGFVDGLCSSIKEYSGSILKDDILCMSIQIK